MQHEHIDRHRVDEWLRRYIVTEHTININKTNICSPQDMELLKSYRQVQESIREQIINDIITEHEAFKLNKLD